MGHPQYWEIIHRLRTEAFGAKRDAIIEVFYEKHLDQLIDVITASCSSKSRYQTIDKSIGPTKPGILSNICELLCFCVLHHPYRLKCNFLMNNAIEKVLLLTRRREKYLVVGAVRFMRTVISRNDEHLLRHIVKNDLLKPIIDAFIENGSRYNMLHSGVLELLEYIRKENLKILIVHIVDQFWDQLLKFEHLGTIQALKVKYDQSLENCQAQNTVNTVDSRRRFDERALEKEEEDYFNEDSDEDDSGSAELPRPRNKRAQPSLANGTHATNSSPSFRHRAGGLVDYEDDDDDEDYKPPPKKPESSINDDKIVVSPNIKRRAAPNSTANDLELKKKHRMDQQTNNASTVICSTSSHAESQSKVMPSPSTSSKSTEESNNEKASVGGSFNCPPEAVDVRQPTGEDSALAPISNSSPEIVVNTASSEPYSVR